MEITVTETPDDAALKALFDQIDGYNDARTGLTEPSRRLAILIRDPATGAVRGGLRGISYYAWLFIEILVLPPDLRRMGLGTRIMRMAEAEAIRRGCRGIWLDTFSFQARPFYERLGYAVFGQIDDYPPGQSRFFLCKRLGPSGLDADTALAEKAGEQPAERVR
ncbi:GNAT family N-acetyltransferase [Limobrevibacterium gyesilva]|uniref:GNAT family N-acetyltransferase n=1 Tax=Limobrevibacterium gyesilva TaxID=2991712 RepID=A0AA41YHE0_9PROT|nr:GNAT family N-acetyltransferase [Limobrevibacterium gyesilva]MCW3473331.1 GNAT family N-acetyltransferase [Limobrevibacterium gyesilva]